MKRPELFFKATARRVRAPGATVGIRSDSTWDVPEPELTLAINKKVCGPAAAQRGYVMPSIGQLGTAEGRFFALHFMYARKKEWWRTGEVHAELTALEKYVVIDVCA